MVKVHDILEKIGEIEPSLELESRILQSISSDKKRMLKRKLFFARAGLAVSFGALAYVLAVFGRSFLDSDFWNLAKLAYSDTGIVFQNLSQFSFSLLETLPVLEIAAMLVPVFSFMMISSWYYKFSNNNHFNHI